MEINFSTAVADQFFDEQRPTLSVGDVVIFDMIHSVKPEQNLTFETFKSWLDRYYNYKRTFGYEEPGSINRYEITGVLTPSA